MKTAEAEAKPYIGIGTAAVQGRAHSRQPHPWVLQLREFGYNSTLFYRSALETNRSVTSAATTHSEPSGKSSLISRGGPVQVKMEKNYWQAVKQAQAAAPKAPGLVTGHIPWTAGRVGGGCHAWSTAGNTSSCGLTELPACPFYTGLANPMPYEVVTRDSGVGDAHSRCAADTRASRPPSGLLPTPQRS